MDKDNEEIEKEDEECMDVDALAACVTIVFEGGRNCLYRVRFGLVFSCATLMAVSCCSFVSVDSNTSPMRCETILHPRLLFPLVIAAPPRVRQL